MSKKPIPISIDRQELTQHGSHDFPIAVITSVFDKRTYDFIDWHWHEHFQFCIVLKGTICFQVGHNRYIIRKGDGIFINSQQIHMSKPYNCELASYLCIDCHPKLIGGDSNYLIYKKYVLPVIQDTGFQALLLDSSDTNGKSILDSIKVVQSFYDLQEPGYELDLNIALLQLYKDIFFCLTVSNQPAEMPRTQRDYFKGILQFVWEEYPNKISLDMIADYIHLSRGECCRYFKKATGQPLFEYIKLFRIHKSIDLLQHTQMSIAEIAQSVGFQTQSYYTECFRKELHMTPGDYRRAISEGALPYPHIFQSRIRGV